MLRTLAATSALAALLLAPACHPRPGTACDPRHEGQCRGKNAAMACEDGIWVLYLCQGPNGCEEHHGHGRTLVVCDLSYSDVGDVCGTDGEGLFACDITDPENVLQCVDREFVHYAECPEGTICTVLPDEDVLDCLPE